MVVQFRIDARAVPSAAPGSPDEMRLAEPLLRGYAAAQVERPTTKAASAKIAASPDATVAQSVSRIRRVSMGERI